jgi:predicted RecA/RadA family phage recombinase
MALNQVFEFPEIHVVCSHPATPSSGDPVRFGEATGVAVTDERADGTTSVDFTAGRVWDLSVKGVDGSGNSAVAVGDKIYYVDADTPVLSKKATGRLFGYALETVASAGTDTIRVMKIMA